MDGHLRGTTMDFTTADRRDRLHVVCALAGCIQSRSAVLLSLIQLLEGQAASVALQAPNLRSSD